MPSRTNLAPVSINDSPLLQARGPWKGCYQLCTPDEEIAGLQQCITLRASVCEHRGGGTGGHKACCMAPAACTAAPSLQGWLPRESPPLLLELSAAQTRSSEANRRMGTFLQLATALMLQATTCQVSRQLAASRTEESGPA